MKARAILGSCLIPERTVSCSHDGPGLEKGSGGRADELDVPWASDGMPGGWRGHHGELVRSHARIEDLFSS